VISSFSFAVLAFCASSLSNIADGEFDAAEMDKELISARIKQDVLGHSGKVHQYVASSVGRFPTRQCIFWS
jgi:hypothetical protein